MSTKSRIFIVGRGPAGMLCALNFAHHDFPVTLIGPAVNLTDARTTALMLPAISFLKKLNIWSKIEPLAAALKQMHIIDATKKLIRSKHIRFCATEIGESFFGYNIPNMVLNDVLNEAIHKHPKITNIVDIIESYTINDNNIELRGNATDYQADFIIAADGRDSKIRSYAKIKSREWDYLQEALVLSFKHQFPHQNISREFHTQTGPCTQVPLPGSTSSLVCVIPPKEAKNLLNYDSERLAYYVETKLFSILGKIELISAPQTWPIKAMKSENYAQKRIFLIGEAAHYFPPIGAQGLNLSIKDIISLTAIFAMERDRLEKKDCAKAMAKLYSQQREKDILLRTMAIDLLNYSLLSNNLPTQLLRQCSISALDKLSFLKQILMQKLL